MIAKTSEMSQFREAVVKLKDRYIDYYLGIFLFVFIKYAALKIMYYRYLYGPKDL